MTSTVLDVTVLLLCVSASVVALGAAGGGVGSSGSIASDAADRIATETVTVTYETREATTDTRTVHATRAELLAMLVSATDREPDDGGAATDDSGATADDGGATTTFTSQARSAITEGLGPRTRLDVRTVATPAGGTSPSNDVTEEGRVELFDGQTSVDAEEPSSVGGATDATDAPETTDATDAPETTDATDATSVTGAPWRLSSETGTPSWPTTATGRSWGEELRPALAAGERGKAPAAGERDNTAGSEVVRTEFGLGPTPPRNADTTTAVLTHPVPDGSGSTESVRIVVRRW